MKAALMAAAVATVVSWILLILITKVLSSIYTIVANAGKPKADKKYYFFLGRHSSVRSFRTKREYKQYARRTYKFMSVLLAVVIFAAAIWIQLTDG